MYQSLLIFGFLAFGGAWSKKLPSYVKPCQRNAHLKECLISNIEAVKPHLKKGVKSFDAPPLDPLVLPLVKMETPTFRLEVRDAIIRGFGDFDVNDVDLDLDSGLFKITLDFPAIDVETNYTMKGSLFSANVSGSGFAEGHAREVRMRMTMRGSRKELDNKKYFDFETENYKLSLLGTKSWVYFRDLVPGNAEMTDSINKLINLHVNDFLYLVEPMAKDGFGGLIARIVKTVFTRYSVDDLFAN